MKTLLFLVNILCASIAYGQGVLKVDEAFIYYAVLPDRNNDLPVNAVMLRVRVDPPFAVRQTGIRPPSRCYGTYGAMGLDGRYTIILICPDRKVIGPIAEFVFTGTRPVDLATVTFESCSSEETSIKCPNPITLTVK